MRITEESRNRLKILDESQTDVQVLLGFGFDALLSDRSILVPLRWCKR